MNITEKNAKYYAKVLLDNAKQCRDNSALPDISPAWRKYFRKSMRTSARAWRNCVKKWGAA